MISLIRKLKGLNPSLFVVSIFILALPFIVNVHMSDIVLSIRYLALSVLIFLLSLLNFRRGVIKSVIKNPLFLSLLLLFFVNIFSALYHDFTADAIVSLFRLFVLLSLTIFFASIFVKEDYLQIAKSILLFSFISLLIYFWQIYVAFTSNKDFMSEVELISATMANKNLLASILFLSLPFLFYVYQSASKFWKILVFLVLALIFCSLIIIQSKAVLLALFIMSFSIILFSFRENKMLVLYFILLVSVISSIVLIASPKVGLQFKQEVSQLIQTKDRFINNQLVENDSRISLYIKTFSMIKDNPVLGVGPGNWKKVFPKYGLYNTTGEKGKKFVQRPHSDFLWFFSEGGVISGLLYMLIFLLLLRDTFYLYIKNKDRSRYFFLILFSTVLGYVFISLLDFPSERPTHNLFLAIILGIVISRSLNKEAYYNTSNRMFGVILICLFSVNIVFSNIRYKGDLHLAKTLKYKSISKWDRMINELDMVYDQYLYDIDNTTTPLMWYYGLAYFNKGDIVAALNYFKKAYSVNPYHVHVINNLATCYGYKGNYVKAKELYEECLFISPRFEEAALNLSLIYSYEERNEEALDILLGVHNFNLAKSSYITDMYVDCIRKISSSLVSQKSYKIACNGIEKEYIFVQGNEDRDLLFEQIKQISWMRKEKEMSFQKIFMSLSI